ncbi:MAG TPA: MFS transporter [Acidimicrobiales bacterium]|nr:MFS transporter [Acidimicrobiales bacterium]
MSTPGAALPPAVAPAEERPLYSRRKRWTIFATVSVSLMMSSIDQTIVATAFHTVGHELHSSVAWTAWTITGYQLGTILAQPVMGRMSDQFGRRRVFIACILIFTLASLACGLAPDIYVLVALRVVQALGGGGFMPSATGMVSDVFREDRDRAIGMFTSMFPIGSLAGPIFGGIIITYGSWREIFLINVPIGAVLLLLALRNLPDGRGRSARRADFGGIALLAAFTGALMTAITVLGNATGTFSSALVSPVFLTCAVAFVVFLVAFVRHLGRTAEPLIPLKLLSTRAFGTMNLLNFIFGGSVVGFGALVPLYAQVRYGINSLQAGTLLTARSAGAVIVAGLTSFALRRIGYRLPMAVGFGVAVCGLVLLAIGPPAVSVYAWLAIGSALMGIGNGIAAPATNNAVLALAPGDVASIAGLRGSIRQLGGIVAISVTTAFVTYHRGDAGATFSHCFIAFAVLIVLVSPLIFTVPERRADW